MKKSLYLLAIAMFLSISHTPAIAENYYFRAKAATIGMNGSAEGINIDSPVILETTTNTLYSITKQPSATGGITPYVWSVTGDSELGINSSTGELSGKPTSAGLKTVNIVATDSKGKKGTTTVQVQVYDVLNISGPTFDSLNIGKAINVTKQPSASGGNLTYTWSLSEGPSWLSINSENGHLAGTPTQSGSFNFKLTVNDTANHNYSKTFSGNVVEVPTINIVDNGITTFTVGDSYNQQFSIVANPAGVTYATGNIPDGTSLNANDNSATVSGTLSKVGNYDYQINTTNASGTGISSNINVNVADKLLLSTFSVDNAVVGENYNVITNPVATGGNGNYIYSIDSQTTGTGLTINSSTGELSGIPTTAGNKTVVVKVVDGNGRSKTSSLNFSVDNVLALSNFSINTPITVGSSYVVGTNPVATGGSGVYTYSIDSQTAGTGLTINSSTGELSGIPTTAGNKTVTIKVVDSNSKEKTVDLIFEVYDILALSSFTIPDSVVNVGYTGMINPVATGGNGSYTYSIDSKTSGAGLSINSSTGELSGTPTTSGYKTIVIKVTDSEGRSITKSTTFNVYSALVLNNPVFGTSTALSSVVISEQPSASGGTGTYTWSLSGNPSWMTIDSSTGVISGTPNTVETFTTQIIVTSGTQTKTSSVVSGTVQTPILTLATTTLANKYTTDSISQDFKTLLTTTGVYDTTAIVWSATSLPTGLTINSSNGIVSGTVETAGTYNFTITAKFTVNGTNYMGIQNYSIIIKNIISVSNIDLGGFHSCALTTSGSVKCWGQNTFGQLGNGTTTNSSTPVQVSGLISGVASVEIGLYHSCIVTTSGGLQCWGANNTGQLGNGTTTSSSIPVQVSGLTSGVASVSIGSNHSCALTTSGSVKCWGSNGSGQLGNGTTTNSSTPVQVSGLTSGVASISAGGTHSCALTTSGSVKCWGLNGNGQLGNGTTTNSSTPVQVSELTSGVASISAGNVFTCAVTTSGGAKCWGLNGSGQLGNGTTTNSSTPVQVSGLTSSVASISAGGTHSCALTTSGGLQCWGANGTGQLGNGTTTSSSTPVQVSGLTSGVAKISSGTSHTCALLSTSGVKCWGWNINGQLGDGTTTNASVPVDVVF